MSLTAVCCGSVCSLSRITGISHWSELGFKKPCNRFVTLSDIITCTDTERCRVREIRFAADLLLWWATMSE